jgi:putative membrane protein
MYIINFIRGFCMALADSMPGVSGGTIAFLLGFYDKFINSLNNLMLGTKEDRVESAKFLFKLGIGWVVGFILSVLLITSVFETHIYEISSLFLGFIIVAIPLIFKEERESLVGYHKNIVFLVIGIAIVWAITYFNPMTSGGNDVSIAVNELSIGLCLYIFFAAIVAISAMVLPGISGSTILLIFGLYGPILTGVKEVLKFNFDYLFGVIIFGFGVLIGIIATIRGVKYTLANYRSKTIYCVIGLMIGSLYAVVMGPTSLESSKAPMTIGTFSVVFFIIGGVLIIGLEKLKVSLKNKAHSKK